MKKILLLTTMVFAGLAVSAQSIDQHRVPVAAKKGIPGTGHTSRNMTCTNDTLYYPYMKELIQAAPSFGYLPFLTGSPTMLSGYSQAYTSTSTTTITGVSFWGFVEDFVNPTQTLNVTVGIYNVNATNQPTTSLGTATVTLTGSVDAFYNVNFSSPITVTGNYAVTIQNPSMTDTLAVILNNASTTTYAENLASLNYAGTWYAATALLTPPAAYEAILSPIVTYPIATDFTVAPAPACEGASITFTNTTTPTGHLTNRAYNWNIFRDYFNYPSAAVQDSTAAWDFGDSSPVVWSTNAAHAYALGGIYNTTLYTFGGFWNSCMDTKTSPVTVTPDAVASYTQDATASPLIAFTSTSTGAVTYSWDFGDGSPLDNTANPSHTFPVGTWNVTLTVTSAGGCNTDMTTQVVTILATDIAGSSLTEFNVFPNPSSTGVFTINMATKANVEVYNMIGELVHASQMGSSSESIDLSGLGAGIYTLKATTSDKNIVKQISITK